MRGLSNSDCIDDLYDTEYIRRNVIDFDAGIGSIFLQKPGLVTRYGQESSRNWLPDKQFSLREAYLIGMRWIYKKLEIGVAREYGTRGLPPVRAIHRHLLAKYEAAMGRGSKK